MKHYSLSFLIIAAAFVLTTLAACSGPAPQTPPAKTKETATPFTSEVKALITITPPIEETSTQTAEPASPTEPAPQIVGGDSDEHGCIGSAGYSWCAATNKCIRIWEEECSSNDEAMIRSLFAKKHERKVAEVSLTNPQITGNFARGGVSFAMPEIEPDSTAPRESGPFLAFKKDGNWMIVFEGNGAADCNAVEEYGFPSAMLEGICY